MTNISLSQILLACAGGLFPALLWLYFWLQEDKAHPEPKNRILYCFLLGMIATPFALVSQIGIEQILLNGLSQQNALLHIFPLGLLVTILYVLAEEILKYFAAYYGGIKHKSNDEPIDVVIYLIVASLGFVAVENSLFIFNSIQNHGADAAIINGNLRFIGASLLHVATGCIIGIFAAFSYFKSKRIKKRYLLVGFILANLLHVLFNLSIISNKGNMLTTFISVWLILIFIIIVLEKIKNIHLNKINT